MQATSTHAGLKVSGGNYHEPTGDGLLSASLWSGDSRQNNPYNQKEKSNR